MSGGDKCHYFNCNKTRKMSNNVFHLIPSSNVEVYRKWIINSGRQSEYTPSMVNIYYKNIMFYQTKYV